MIKSHNLPLLILVVAMLAISGCSPVPSVPPVEPTQLSVPPTSAVSAAASPAPAAAPEATAVPDERPIVPAPAADGSRPLAALSPAERADRFSGPAENWIEPGKLYVATIVTPKGNIVAELYPDTATSVNNFVTLALNGFYDGLAFHRVEPGFVVQGGDPVGDGSGGPGYTIAAEILHTHPRGALAWARTGDQINPERRSSGSQFYITLDAAAFLDGAYTVFGYVIEGMEVVDTLAIADVITRVDIAEASVSRLPTPTPTPEPKAPAAEEGRPLAKLSAEERHNYYNMPPATLVDFTKAYQATVATDLGDIVIDLDATSARQAVNSLIMLANLGFYDGLPVAYVQADGYVVLGSPGASPDSDAGYRLAPEVAPEGSVVITGTVSMYPFYSQTTGDVLASSSQFFIAFAPPPDNETPLSVIGTVTQGLDTALKLEAGTIVKSIVIT